MQYCVETIKTALRLNPKGHTKLHIKKKSSGAKKKKKKNYLEIKPSNMKTMSVDPLCYQILIFISE